MSARPRRLQRPAVQCRPTTATSLPAGLSTSGAGMSWYRTPDSLGRPAMSDLLPTDFPPVFFCGPSVLASQSALTRRGSPGVCRRRRSTWHWHGPVDGRTRCLLPSTPAMVPRTHHPSSPDASSSGPWQHVPAPLQPPWPSLPRHRSGAQLPKLVGSSSEHLKPAIPSSQNCIMPSGLHFNISSASSSWLLSFLDLLASKPLIRLPALLTARLLLHHHVLICLTTLLFAVLS